MAKNDGSLGRGRRRRDEVPDVPDKDGLTDRQRRAQGLLKDMVERAGGRFDSKTRLEVNHIDAFRSLFEEWAYANGELRGGRMYFSGNPGLWHALDSLYPLQDPNRWDLLRREVIASLEKSHWTRISPPRGSSFSIEIVATPPSVVSI